MNAIKIVSGSYAAVERKTDEVLGTITLVSDTQWGWRPLFDGNPGPLMYVDLHHALTEGLRFRRSE